MLTTSNLVLTPHPTYLLIVAGKLLTRRRHVRLSFAHTKVFSFWIGFSVMNDSRSQMVTEKFAVIFRLLRAVTDV